jgi:hypothetical protein
MGMARGRSVAIGRRGGWSITGRANIVGDDEAGEKQRVRLRVVCAIWSLVFVLLVALVRQHGNACGKHLEEK